LDLENVTEPAVRPDDVLDQIDQSLCDNSVSGDAMRWTPDPSPATAVPGDIAGVVEGIRRWFSPDVDACARAVRGVNDLAPRCAVLSSLSRRRRLICGNVLCVFVSIEIMGRLWGRRSIGVAGNCGDWGGGTASVVRGDARVLPLPDESVDPICTSPPYFALRSSS
jgi:hypothetical protein